MRRAFAVVSVCFLSAAAGATPATRTIELARKVVNLETYAGALERKGTGSDVWRGTIPHEARGVPFEVEFREDQVIRARADANRNGDLADDGDAKLALYPGKTPGRSFLVTLPWTTKAATPSDRLVRVVVPPVSEERRPYRIQEVYGMLGSVGVDGKTHLALLYDSNRDGRYTKKSGDGVFLDLDDDRHFPIDVLADAFGPFGIPFTLGRETVTVEEVDAAGSRLTLRTVGPAAPIAEIDAGVQVPDLPFLGSDGRTRLLSATRGKPLVVYFWSSTCESCRADAEGLQSMYARWAPDDLEILGVSYDSEIAPMEEFRKAHGHTWPSSFNGGIPWADPVGRWFRETKPGAYFVIDAGGRVVTRVTTLDQLNEQLMALAGPPRR